MFLKFRKKLSDFLTKSYMFILICHIDEYLIFYKYLKKNIINI